MRFSKIIHADKNQLLIFDNWFTSVPLICYLAKSKVLCLGAVRSNKLRGCTLPSDRDMKKLGRGAYLEKQCTIDNIKLRTIRWMDTKAVTLLTSLDFAQLLTSAKCYETKSKKKIDVSCPNAVVTYNAHMGGVDLLDSLIALYHIKLRF